MTIRDREGGVQGGGGVPVYSLSLSQKKKKKKRLTATRTIDIKVVENSQVQNNLRTRPQLIATTAAGNTVTKTVSAERLLEINLAARQSFRLREP